MGLKLNWPVFEDLNNATQTSSQHVFYFYTQVLGWNLTQKFPTMTSKAVPGEFPFQIKAGAWDLMIPNSSEYIVQAASISFCRGEIVYLNSQSL